MPILRTTLSAGSHGFDIQTRESYDMPEMIMPNFGQFPIEGQIIGRLLTGYGELEFELSNCVGAATGGIDLAIAELFSKRGEEKRIKLAIKKAGPLYSSAGLDASFKSAVNDMDYCRLIRNQYAHCHWYSKTEDGLAFIDLEAIAKISGTIWPLEVHRRLIDSGLLEQQEAFFIYVKKCFWYLKEEYQTRANGRSAHIWHLPAPVRRPPKHK